MNRWSALAVLLALAGAVAVRVPQLAARPLHNDEAINASKLAALWEKGEYSYNPDEFHGPTLYYFSLPVLWWSAATQGPQLNEDTLRLVTVAFGTALILLVLLLTDGLGPQAAGWAALLLAVSPAMVFYSRYFIHEMLLVFFTLLTLAAGWRYWRSPRVGWAVLTGAGIGLMFATKETFVLSLVAMLSALFATRFWNRWRLQRASAPAAGPLRSGAAAPPAGPGAGRPRRDLCLVLATAALVWLVFFTSFFTNAAGLFDSIKTYLPWLHRAGGASPHIHPWSFYLERLVWFHPPKSPVWSEALILFLGMVGGCFAFTNNPALRGSATLTRFLAFYTLILTLVYSGISYKTPWCLLNFWLGMILLAGVGAAGLVQLCRRRFAHVLLFAVLVLGVGHLGWQAWRAAVTRAADWRNPYTYSQTTEGCRQLVARVEALARVAPTGQQTVVKVIAPESYWPLPWYLRSLKRIGWWDQLPADPYAPIILVSARLNALLDEKSGKAWIMTGYYELRPGVYFELYVERALWEKFVATLPRPPD